MSSQSPPAQPPKPKPSTRAANTGPRDTLPLGLRAFDGVILTLFLGLTFLLGVFPNKDTDFWWHLRTGDLIRQTHTIPTADIFTYGADGNRWFDMHWVFQVAVSYVYELGGMPALNLAKCVVTTLAVLLLVTARRRDWPVWAMVLGWLPAVLLLGGRMYVRPETLTLLYLSAFLAVLTRLDRFPKLAFVLPAVQLAWVNTQGLFVLGPILWAFALLDAALRPGAFAAGRSKFWRTALTAAVLTGLACLVNPYGLSGALYPLELARTMGNPVFSNTIAELTPIPAFIKKSGLTHLILRLHLFTMFFGALSFLLPMGWLVWTRGRDATEAKAGPPARLEAGKKGAKAPKKPAKKAPKGPETWRLSAFRLFLFLAFSLLSWQATRNSHQFAAVVGAVTAWNLGEWAAAARRRRVSAGERRPGVGPRVGALVAVAAVLIWVGSGVFYAQAKEGRTIGLGQQPLWFPHEAVKFAGSEGMPPKFLSYHIGHASLYDYYHGPEKKVYVDARLEVIGPDLYERYMNLNRRIVSNESDWSQRLDAIGRPVVLADHEGNAAVSSRLLESPDWRCVWFDPVAAVFVHAAYDEVVRAHQVDFAARHFRPEAANEPPGVAALLASAKGLRNVVLGLRAGSERGIPLILLGQDHAHRVLRTDPDNSEAWRMIGQLESRREPPMDVPVPRFRMPFDPVFDLSAVRATYALRRALEALPDDFTLLLYLEQMYEPRAMNEAAAPVLEHMMGLVPINAEQSMIQASLAPLLKEKRSLLGPTPPASWDNLNQLGQIVNELLAHGRAATAADYLERAAPPGARTWDEADRIATLRLHLGEPARARALWAGAPAGPKPGARLARVAATYLVEGDYEKARATYQEALAAEPGLFESLYGLAVLEQDAGRAVDALRIARKAAEQAATDVARSAARGIVSFVTPYAVPAVAGGRAGK